MTHDAPRSGFRSASPRDPCPVCGRQKYCRIRDDGMAWCSKASSGSPPAGWRQPKGCKPGCLVPDDGENNLRHTRRRIPRPPVVRDELPTASHCEHFEDRAEDCARRLTTALARRFADRLDTTPEVLRAVGCGWDGYNLTTPMRLMIGGSLCIVGLATRANDSDGSKRMHTGSRRGLFLVPQLLADAEAGAEVWVPEGASDTFAALAAGWLAVGRTADRATAFERETLRDLLRPFNVSVVADADEPGQQGARELAAFLAAHWRREVAKLTPRPPHNDLRDLLRGIRNLHMA